MPFDFTTTPDPVTQVLLRAREIVAKRWRQHSTGSPGRARCAAGAIIEVAGLDRPSYRAAFRCLEDCVPRPLCNLVQYNDYEGRTQEEIVALFDQAIERQMARVG